MLKAILGSALAAVAMFAWGFVFWGFLPLDPFQRTSLDQEVAIGQMLSLELPGPGVYFVPDRGTGGDAGWVARHQVGPLAKIAFQPLGADPQSPVKMAMGFAHVLVVSALLAAALWSARLTSYGGRLGLAVLIGLSATVFANLAEPIWFDMPWEHHLVVGGYQLVAWLIAGIVLAFFAKQNDRLRVVEPLASGNRPEPSVSSA